MECKSYSFLRDVLFGNQGNRLHTHLGELVSQTLVWIKSVMESTPGKKTLIGMMSFAQLPLFQEVNSDHFVRKKNQLAQVSKGSFNNYVDKNKI